MNQINQGLIEKQRPSKNPKRKTILKRRQQQSKNHQNGSFASRITNITNQRLKFRERQLQQSNLNRPQKWLQFVQECLPVTLSQVDTFIQEQKLQFPILQSIDQLFSLSSNQRLEQQLAANSHRRYFQLTSFLDAEESLLLSNYEEAYAAHLLMDRLGQERINSILKISLQQKQMLQKRACFMEKLKVNQLKYDPSLGRMSQLSKQLAFTYRIYLQSRNQLFSTFDSISSKINTQEQQNTQVYERYSRFLVLKNLRHAFTSNELDPFNYFKLKEHIESSRVDSFQNIRNSLELKCFIDKRRPKRGRKLALATACSVCFSDYYELCNPLHACGVCGLRAHQLCFPFSSRKCGNCAYQKVERHIKEKVSPCFICRQSGTMIIKLSYHEYAHAFCLLIHSFWEFPSIYNHLDDDVSITEFASDFKLDKRNRNFFKEIEFKNPNKKQIKTSVKFSEQTELCEQQIKNASYDNERLQKWGVLSFQSLKKDGDIWEEKKIVQQLPKCACCDQAFFEDCFLKCVTCQKDYHAFCAYFSGCDLKMNDDVTQLEGNIRVNCCVEGGAQRAWNRKYKLNYSKVAFVSPQATHSYSRDPMQEEDHFMGAY